MRQAPYNMRASHLTLTLTPILYAVCCVLQCGGGGPLSGYLLTAATAFFMAIGPSVIYYMPRVMPGCLLMHIGVDLTIEGSEHAAYSFIHCASAEMNSNASPLLSSLLRCCSAVGQPRLAGQLRVRVRGGDLGGDDSVRHDGGSGAGRAVCSPDLHPAGRQTRAAHSREHDRPHAALVQVGQAVLLLACLTLTLTWAGLGQVAHCEGCCGVEGAHEEHPGDAAAGPSVLRQRNFPGRRGADECLSVCMYVCMYVGAGPCHGISVSFLRIFLPSSS